MDHGIVRRLLTTGTHLAPDTAREPGFDLKKLPRTPAASPASPAMSVPA